MSESEILSKASLVSVKWADVAGHAHANLMHASVGYHELLGEDEEDTPTQRSSVALSMERSWSFLNTRFPWACFLSEGTFKKVFKVHNAAVGAVEALSVM